MIPWIAPVLIWIVIGKGFQPWLTKKIVKTGEELNKQGFAGTTFLCFTNFAVCVIYTLPLALLAGKLSWNGAELAVVAVGFLNAMANLAYWKGMAISLSRISLYLILDDIIAMGLAYLILNEARFLNNGISAGVTICFLSAIFFSLYRKRKAEIKAGASDCKPSNEKLTPTSEFKFAVYVLIFSVTWGMAMFSMNYFPQVKQVNTLAFIACWYIGSTIGASLLFILDKRLRPKLKTINAKTWKRVALVSICMPISNASSVWAYSLGHQIIIQPIFLVSEMTVPVLIGLYLFGEIKDFDWLEKTLFILGVLGVLIIAFSK